MRCRQYVSQAVVDCKVDSGLRMFLFVTNISDCYHNTTSECCSNEHCQPRAYANRDSLMVGMPLQHSACHCSEVCLAQGDTGMHVRVQVLPVMGFAHATTGNLI